ncbi:MAG: electron transport complex subunit RsxG [Pseudomonadota bacterium]
MIWKNAARMGALLAAFAVLSTAVLAFTYLQTKKIVDRNEAAALLERMDAIIPKDRYDNELLKDSITVRSPEYLGTNAPVTVYRARQHGRPVGVIFRAVAPNGYSGNITLLVGIYADGRIAGVRVLSHRETPGLGDPIEVERSPWILSFDGKSLQNPPPNRWAVRKDGGAFDQFTGATITPRAVVGAVKRALQFYESRQDELFARPAEHQPPAA